MTSTIAPRVRTKRRVAVHLLGMGLLAPLAACGRESREPMQEVVLNVVLYSYLDRVITDIIFNGTDLGVANKFGGTGTMTGVRIPIGNQTLSWRLDGPKGTVGNGDKVKVKNKLTVSPQQISPGTRYMGLHLYPDDTAEGTFAEFIPERSPRGKKLVAERHRKTL